MDQDSCKKTISMTTFNCKSVKRSMIYVRELCNKYDIISLQETWLLPEDIDFLSQIHTEFSYYGVTGMDTSAGPLRGRPYGGVAILWRKSIFQKVIPIHCESKRIVAVRVQLLDRSAVVMSVYIPTDCSENLPLFTECLGAIHSITQDCDDECVFMLGDYNANIGSVFGRDLLRYCKDQSWTYADIRYLGESSNHEL